MWIRLYSRIRFLFARERFDRDLAEEMDGHRALLEAEKIRQGLSPEEAAIGARRQFGNTVIAGESSREIWSIRWIDALCTDLRSAMRTVRRQPGIAAAAILALAVGIGASAATWSLAAALLLRPLAVEEPERLFWAGSGKGLTSAAVTYPTYSAVRDADVFDGLAANGVWRFPVTVEGAPQSRDVCFVSYDYFRTLGVRIQPGRDFSQADDRRSALPTVIVSDRFWRTALHADDDAIGRPVLVGGKQSIVIGIAPRDFLGLNLAHPPDIFMPLHTVGVVGGSVSNYFSDPVPPAVSSPSAWIGIVGRLKSGVTAGQAAERLTPLFSLRSAQGDCVLTNVNTLAIPLNRADTVTFVQILTITIGLILLTGCLSVGTLLFVRTEARNDELAMRAALGASRARIVRGIMVEGALLSLTGAVIALPVSQILLRSLHAFEVPGRVRISSLYLAVDGRILAAAGLAAAAACMLIGLVAALRGSSVDVPSGLRPRAGATPGISRRRTGSVLVVAHVAIAFVLLSGAGLFVHSLTKALRLNPGFETGQIITGHIPLGQYGYTPARSEEFFANLETRLAGNPVVESLSFNAEYFGMSSGGTLRIDGIERTPPGYVRFVFVGNRFFRTMGMRIEKGRDFSESDVEDGTPVAIVSRSFSRMLPQSSDPLGKSVIEPVAQPGKPFRVLRIIGIVPDVVTDINVLEPIVIYQPFPRYSASPDRNVVIRSAGNPKHAIRDAMSTIMQLDKSIVAAPMRTMDQQLWMQVGPQRLGASALASLGAIAAFLCMLGVYVLAKSIAVQRQDEMRIRAALGAHARQLIRPMIGEIAKCVGIGLACGISLTWMGKSLISALLYKVDPLDPAALGTASAAILVTAVAVSLGPALRSIAETDPVKLLKTGL